MRLPIALGLVICASAACTQGPPTPVANVEADRAALNKLRAEYPAAFNSGDAEAMANVYAIDATLMPPGEQAVTGRTAIQEYFKSQLAQFTIKAALESQEFSVVGPDWAFDRGTYTLTITPKAGGDAITQENKYITLLHREPDGWKAKRDIYNSNKP
jgi:uncharacterized protein (TIGR02246 family)